MNAPRDDAGALAGLRVAVTRSVDRAGGLLAALDAAGTSPVLVPLIDFEMSDNNVLTAALARLAAGEYRWVVFSSITTVRALKQWCAGHGTALTELIPATTQVATIGPTSADVLAAEGIRAELAPHDVQSAAGLVAIWPDFDPASGTGNRVLMPSSNLAAPTLVDGLTAKGWAPETVTAYNTVDYPARDGFRLTAQLTARSSERGWISEVAPRPKKSYCPREDLAGNTRDVLTPAEAAGEIQAGAIDAVVLASGSAVRRVAQTLAPLPESCLVIAIGEPTRVEAQRLGMRVAATAEHPTPEGIVAALAAAHRTFLRTTEVTESS